MQPVRRIGKNHRAVNGTLASRKAVGNAQFESTLERDFYTLLEFDPAVATFTTQPVKFTYHPPGLSRRSYVPDTLVHYLDGRQPGLFEVKYVAEVQEKHDEMRWRFQAARRYARAQGWTFTLVTEKSLRGQRLENARFLLPYVGRAAEPQRAAQVLQGVAAPTTPRALFAHLSLEERGAVLPVLWHLVATRAIACDLDAPLNMDARLWPAGAP